MTAPRRPDEPDEEKPRSGAQTVERAIAILNLFRDGRDALGISAIARETGLNVSTAHRLVKTLVHEHFMEQDPMTEQYRLGTALAILGQRAVQSSGLGLAQPVIDALADSTGESVSLAIRRGDDVVVVLQSTSKQALRFDHPTGGAINLHASGMGKVLLAFSGVEPKVAVSALGRLPTFTPSTITTQAALVAELEGVRREGYALNEEERYVGVCGVAAPVNDAYGVARYAIGVQGPAVRLTPARLRQLAPAVVEAASAVAELVLRGR